MKDSTKHAYRTSVGMRIRRERILWNMTQDDLSQALGISTNYLGQIERGARDISRKMEDRLCELFHLTHEEFRRQNGLDPYWTSQTAEDGFVFLDMQETDLLRLLRSCSDEELQFCGHLVRSTLSFLRKPGLRHIAETALPDEGTGDEVSWILSPASPVSVETSDEKISPTVKKIKGSGKKAASSVRKHQETAP